MNTRTAWTIAIPLVLLLSAVGVTVCDAQPPVSTDIAPIIKLAKQGDAEAQYKFGVMYDYGFGVPKDSTEAAKWHKLAADQGHTDAQFNLGIK